MRMREKRIDPLQISAVGERRRARVREPELYCRVQGEGEEFQVARIK